MPRKLNIVADALSRIHINDIIKTQKTTIHAMTTRSKTRNAHKQMSSDQMVKIPNEADACTINESSGTFVSKKVPLFKTNKGPSDKKIYSIVLRNKNTNIELARASTPINKESFLNEIFVKLNQETGGLSLKLFKIYRDDNIFALISVE